MAEHVLNTTPTRRGMLGRLAVAAPMAGVAAGTADAAHAGPHPDAELLELARVIAEADAENDRIADRHEDAGDFDFPAWEHPTIQANVARIHASIDRMGRVPARTSRGALVKAATVRDELVNGETGYGDAVAISLVEDLERMTGWGA